MNLKKTFFKGNGSWWCMYVTCLMIDGMINVILSIILQQVTDATVKKDMQQLINAAISSAIVLAGTIFVMGLQYYAEARFLKKAMTQYKNTVLENLLKKNRRSFTMENTSVYISSMTNDAATIEASYLQGTAKLICYIVSFVVTLAVMVMYSPLLTLIVLLLSFLPVLISMLTGKKLELEEKEVSAKNASFVGMIKDMLSGFSVIKSFRAETEIEKLYQKNNDSLEGQKYKRTLAKGKINILSSVGMVISQLGVFFVGAFLVITEKGVTAGTLIAFVNMMGALMQPISLIPQYFAGRKAALGLIDKMEQILKENVETEAGEVLEEFQGGITLQNVTFGYTEETEVLKDVSLKLVAGKSYAIVGGSGSGKSTLLDLMMGNFEKYKGSVSFDGKDLKTINLNSLYDFISVIQQNVFIFDSTIRKNITMYKEFPEPAVKRAIELSGLKKLIEEKGENYLCGENGCNLSGGERQRISIARSLLRNTPILVADEATAALDAKTAYEVIDAILDMEDLTRVVVTHQLEETVLSRYDGIIVMKNGKIVEMGSFEELMDNKNYFYSLYNVSEAA